MEARLDLKTIWRLSKETVEAWLDDYAPSMGAALSYYTMFSIAPLLIIIIAVAGLVFGREAAQGQIMSQLSGLIGVEGAAAVQGLVKSASSEATSIFATIAGIATLVIGATTVFGELQTDLDRIWRAPARIKPSGIWGLLRTRFLSFGLVLGIGFVLLVSLVLSAGIAALGNWWAPLFGGWEVVLHVVNLVVSFVIITVLFGMIYKLLPSVKIAWRDVWVGAAVTALLFSIGKSLIGLYIGKSGVVSGFGAAGSIVVLLVWVYYSAQIFLFGAEFTYVFAHDCGSLRDKEERSAAAAGVPVASEDPVGTRGYKDEYARGGGALPAAAATTGVSAASATPGRAHPEAAAPVLPRPATAAGRGDGWPGRDDWLRLGIAASAGYVLGELSTAAGRFATTPRRRPGLLARLFSR